MSYSKAKIKITVNSRHLQMIDFLYVRFMECVGKFIICM